MPLHSARPGYDVTAPPFRSRTESTSSRPSPPDTRLSCSTPPPERVVAVLCDQPNEARLFGRADVSAQIIVAGDTDDFARIVTTRKPDAWVIVLDNDFDDERLLGSVADREFPDTPILIRAGLSHAMASQAIRLSARHPNIHLSLQGRPAERDLGDLLAPVGFAALRGRLLGRLAERTPASVHPIMTAAVVAGSRQTSVPEFASVCQMSVRLLQAKLADAGVTSARRLLNITLAAHAVWGTTKLGLDPKLLADQLGVPSARTLNRRLVRLTGLSLPRVRAIESIEHLLDRLVELASNKN